MTNLSYAERKALAEQGDVTAQINVGSIYQDSDRVPKGNYEAF